MQITRTIAFHISGVLLALTACTNSVPAPTPGPNEVWLQVREFTPNVITVPAGTTITWVNKDKRLHTVTSDTGLFNATLEPYGSFSYTFTGNGTFIYHDEYDEAHREVGGVVYVK